MTTPDLARHMLGECIRDAHGEDVDLPNWAANELLAEYDRRAEVIERVRALGEEIQRGADHNTNAVAPAYLRGVEQARIAARIRRALEDET